MCIHPSLRCDSYTDCADHTDEAACSLVSLPPGHSSLSSPLSHLYVSHISSSLGGLAQRRRTEVGLTVSSLSLTSVSQLGASLRVRIALSMVWFHPGITFNYLKQDKRRNLVNLSQTPLWTPQLSFPNSRQEDTTRPLRSQVVVVRKRVDKSGRNEELVMREVYQGADNPLEKNEIYDLVVRCSFENIHLYPFDTETCQIEMLVDGVSNFDTDLVPIQPVAVVGPKEVDDFLLTSWSFLPSTLDDGRQIVILKITLERPLIGIFFLKYFPVILINIINQTTNYLGGKKNIDAILGVNVTSMVVITVILISTSANLPPSTRMKNIEKWFLGCFTYPFLVIVLNVSLRSARLKKIQDSAAGEAKAVDDRPLCNGSAPHMAASPLPDGLPAVVLPGPPPPQAHSP